MKKIAPAIFRQRLLIEGHYQIPVQEKELEGYFAEITKKLNLRAYGQPTIFQPDSGMGREENAGYDAFLPLIDSGISVYVWSKHSFISVILFTCKEFNV